MNGLIIVCLKSLDTLLSLKKSLDTWFDHTHKKYISFNYFKNKYYQIILFCVSKFLWTHKQYSVND